MLNVEESKYEKAQRIVTARCSVCARILAIGVAVLFCTFVAFRLRGGSFKFADVSSRASPHAGALSRTSAYGSASWSDADPRECAGYFGNGFTTSHVLAPGLSCKSNPSTGSVQCVGHHMILHPHRVEVYKGGDPQPDTSTARKRDQKRENLRGRSDGAGEPTGSDGEGMSAGRSRKVCLPVFKQGAWELVQGGFTTGLVGEGEEEERIDEAREEDESGVAEGVPLSTMDSSGLGAIVSRSDKMKGEMLRSINIVQQKNVEGHDEGHAGERRNRRRNSTSRCKSVIHDPVLVVTRMEYANLYHTSTDWYNVWATARMHGLSPTVEYSAVGLSPESLVTPTEAKGGPRAPKTPAHVLFMDGHHGSGMDDGWLALFLSVTYVKGFTPDEAVCFDTVLFAPFGYTSPLSTGLVGRSSCRSEPHVSQFRADMVAGLGLTPAVTSSCGAAARDGTPPAVLWASRLPATAIVPGSVSSGGKGGSDRVSNEADIQDALVRRAADGTGSIVLLPGHLSATSFRAQVEAVQGACVIAGVHGAGLSHILLAPPGVHVLELQPPAFARPHFIAYAAWAGAVHHVMGLSSTTPNTKAVVDKVVEVAHEAIATQAVPKT